MHISNLSLINLSVFTVTAMDGDVYVLFSGDSSPLLRMSREEALELSCKLEQAAQKIEEKRDT